MRSALLGLGVLVSFVSAVFAAAPKEIPVVYMTKSITPEGMVRAYQALNWKPSGLPRPYSLASTLHANHAFTYSSNAWGT